MSKHRLLLALCALAVITLVGCNRDQAPGLTDKVGVASLEFRCTPDMNADTWSGSLFSTRTTVTTVGNFRGHNPSMGVRHFVAPRRGGSERDALTQTQDRQLERRSIFEYTKRRGTIGRAETPAAGRARM